VALGRLAISSWLLIVFLVVWEVWARRAESLFIPPMSEILSKFREVWLSGKPGQLFLSDQFWSDGKASLTRAGVGWTLSVVVGVVGGLVLGRWRAGELFFNPMIRFGLSTPTTILLPVAILIFGIENSMNIFLIAFGGLWVILINTIDGVQSIHSTTLLTARSLRMGKIRSFFKIFLPAASPQIVTGLRVSIGIALILMVVSELYAASEGIGFYIIYRQRTFRYTEMWSAILLLALIGVVANLLFAAAEKRVMRWHRESIGGADQ
jgi:ABC-type nitrate/sulfonate/bicarbonate transport system permease component